MTLPPDRGSDPTLWLSAAREHLVATEAGVNPLRVRCFHGQRSVELAVKAVLIFHNIEFPKVHTLERLIAMLPEETVAGVPEVGALTPYAVEEMYPDTFTELTDDHADAAVEVARSVVAWASSIIDT